MDKWLIKTPKPLSEALGISRAEVEEEPEGNQNSENGINELEGTLDERWENSDVSDRGNTTDISNGSPKEKKKLLMKRKRKVYTFSNNWFEVSEFKGWLSKSDLKNEKGDEFAFCKVCRFKMLAQKSCLYRHCASSRHLSNWRQVSENANISDIYKTNSLDDNIRRAEIELCGLVASNNLPFVVMDTLAPLCTQIFPDSAIARRLSVKRTEATAIVKEAL
ncbi:hypothetical protein JTB14_007030 [Gonioctena quinquepunctata]|nr:hypothetical protein JTB14_007030 [Gonioctena quinquepunctata]